MPTSSPSNGNTLLGDLNTYNQTISQAIEGGSVFAYLKNTIMLLKTPRKV